MENLDRETIKLIEELCQKEVERTGLPLVYDERETSKSDITSKNTLYIHQKMTLNLKGFDSIILTNQNSLVLENGKWTVISVSRIFSSPLMMTTR